MRSANYRTSDLRAVVPARPGPIVSVPFPLRTTPAVTVRAFFLVVPRSHTSPVSRLRAFSHLPFSPLSSPDSKLRSRLTIPQARHGLQPFPPVWVLFAHSILIHCRRVGIYTPPSLPHSGPDRHDALELRRLFLQSSSVSPHACDKPDSPLQFRLPEYHPFGGSAHLRSLSPSAHLPPSYYLLCFPPPPS
jgi:hypothetical protein